MDNRRIVSAMDGRQKMSDRVRQIAFACFRHSEIVEIIDGGVPVYKSREDLLRALEVTLLQCGDSGLRIRRIPVGPERSRRGDHKQQRIYNAETYHLSISESPSQLRE